jgi:hypothetical protein
MTGERGRRVAGAFSRRRLAAAAGHRRALLGA